MSVAFPILAHAVQITAYTTIIYFLGGTEATYLIPIYGALITYDGVVSSKVVLSSQPPPAVLHSA